jgi:quinol-cytochrome oxidoreductase complex cytochrome b subunit
MAESGDSAGGRGPVRSLRSATGAGETTGSARKLWGWLEGRLGLPALRYRVPEHANVIWYTLGGITLMSILIAVASGIWLAQYYNPDPTGARESVIFIENQAPLGDVIRGIHIWSAYIAVIGALLHMGRIFVTASYKAPRELNWLVGVVLLSLIMFGAVFSGTVLRWDQEAYEAMAHLMEIANLFGTFGVLFSDAFTTSVSMLPRTYIVHISLVPLALVFFLVAHFFLVKYHHISPTPAQEDAGEAPGGKLPPEKETSRYTTHLRLMLSYGLVVLGIAGALAVLWPQPIGPAPDPTMEITKPSPIYYWLYAFEDWFGLNALLYATIAFFSILAIVPFVDRSRFRSPRKRPVMIGLGILLLVAIVVLTIITYVSPVVSHIEG